MTAAGSFGIGERVGRFRLLAPLGEGAMGRVWRAQGPSGLVAVKLLSAHFPGGRERFEREARALLKLRHPNVVRAVDYGLADDGTPFMALELLGGESLEERMLRDRRLPVREAVAIVCAAAEGLAAAHALGIIHRDVKPGNIFVTEGGAVKVLDFGIAFWSEGDGRLPVSRLTEPGVVMGTPSYMAPEQAAGDRDEDERTDVWGLGAVLYDMIAGREPFRAGDNYLAELTRILTDAPDPLPEEVPAGVAWVIMRALRKPREERFPSVSEMATALLASAGRESLNTIAPIDPKVMGALAEEIRLVSAVLVEGLDQAGQAVFLEALRRHGGVGSTVRGQRAVAVFGGDAWLGDEAERAVKTSLEIRAHAERIAVGTGKAVRRIDQLGLVTGQVIAAAQTALRAADAEVPTIRPQALGHSGPGRVPAPIIVCPETQRRLVGGFDLLGDRVLGIRRGGRMLRPREVGGREVPFVGRSHELEDLYDIIDEVDVAGRAAAVLISGPPGIGKSRLRFELLRLLEAEGIEARQFEARGEIGHGRSSFGVVRELLRGQAELPEGTDPEKSRALVEELVASTGMPPERRRGTADFIGELLGVPFPDNPHLLAARNDPLVMADRIRLACGDLFDGWTKQGLVLVSIEDVQWADSASLALIDSLLVQLAERPLAVVATARPNFIVEHDALDSAVHIELSELLATDTAAIVERVLGRPEPAIVERAAGNPYLAEELSLAVREGADPAGLPLTVEGAVLARLDKLSPDEKDLLKRAAILGRRFWREALEALGEPLAAELLGTLRRRELVVPNADSRLYGCEEWLFRQDIIFEVCRGLLTEEQRQRLHRAAASWLSRRLDAAAQEVAEHFEAAGERGRAALWWLRAVHGAHAQGDSRNVMRFGARALALSEAVAMPVAERLSIHLLRCEASFWLGDREALERELGAAASLSGAEVSDAALAKLRCWQAMHVEQSGHLDEALFAAGHAAALADKSTSYDLMVQARATTCSVLAAQGDLDRAAAVATEALEIAKQGEGSMIRAMAARALADVEAQRGHLSAALFYYSMARNLCLEVGSLREATENGIGLGACLTAAGDYQQAHRILEKTLRNAESLALGAVVGWVEHHLSLIAFLLGDIERARALAAHALVLARDDAHLMTAAHAYTSILERESGNAQAALESAERSIEAAVRHGTRIQEPLSRALRAQALVVLGRYGEALEECERAFEARDAVGGMIHSEVDLILCRYDALAALGRREQALATLRAAHRCFETRLSMIEEESLRRSFSERVPSHARLARLLAGGT